jgi:hypothetical protein
LPYHNQIDYGEGMVQYVNNMWATNTWKWNINISPYSTLMYGIGMPIITMPLIKLFGDGLWVGRIPMVLSTLVILWLLYKLVRKATGKVYLGIVAALLPLSHPVIRGWSIMLRVDMLAIVFDIAGLYVAYRYRHSKWIYTSIILFVCAALTKVTILMGFGSVGLYLLFYNRKVFIKYALLSLVSFGMTFGGMQLISHGQYLAHVITLNRTTSLWGWNVITSNILNVTLPMLAVLVIAILCAVKSIKLKRVSMMVFFFILSLVCDNILALLQGSYVNYSIELILATCICTAIYLPIIIRTASHYYNRTQKINLQGATYALVIIGFLTFSLHSTFPFPNSQYMKDCAIVEQIISDTTKPVPSENAGICINTHKDIIGDFFVLTNLKELGLWDATQYDNNYVTEYYDYIIMRMPLSDIPGGDGFYTKAEVQTIVANYDLIYSSPPEQFYWYGLYLYESKIKLNPPPISK